MTGKSLNKQKDRFKCQICIDVIGKSADYTRSALKTHMKIAHKAKTIGESEK